MTNQLRISQDLISTNAAPAVENRRPVTAAAVPALRTVEAHESLPLLEHYDLVFITPQVKWEEVDLFLLGEKHYNATCNKINGAFIRAVGGDRPISYMEGVPSMLPVPEQEQCREELGLSSTAKFFGWDASEDVQDMLRAEEGSTIENLAKTRKEIKDVSQQLAKTRGEIQETLQQIDRFYSKKSTENVLQVVDALKQQKQALDNLCHVLTGKHDRLTRKKQSLMRLIKKEIIHISNPMRSTFPIRTQAMIATLQQLRKKDSTACFIAGHAHLRSSPLPLLTGPEFDLKSLYEELYHHKAAILIPKECRATDEIFNNIVDTIKLPEGFILTAEQKAELKDKLISQATTGEKVETIISQFLESVPMQPDIEEIEEDPAIDLDKLIDEIELPGLILTAEQKAELKDKLISQATSVESTQAIIIQFLESVLMKPDMEEPATVADRIIEELELPEGLILTAEQKAELKEKLSSCLLQKQDFSITLQEFLMPIMMSFFSQGSK
ncbi:MAG: hypothetical protein ABSA17_04370 [Rhabdochlamydiaceae bacterium]|jgi:hypothetical protein